MEGAVREQPFGPGMIVWTIEGHMFAAYTEAGQGLSVRVTDEAGRAAKLPPADAAATGEGWVLVPWQTPPEELRLHIAVSYRLVRADRRTVSGDL